MFTNDVLFHWNIKTSNHCDICYINVKQDITHLIWKCSVSEQIWKQLKMLIQVEDIVWSLANVMSNLVHEKPDHIVNFIVLMVKQILYRLKCLEQKPTIDCVLVELNTLYYIEKHKARITRGLTKFVKSWETVKSLIPII